MVWGRPSGLADWDGDGTGRERKGSDGTKRARHTGQCLMGHAGKKLDRAGCNGTRCDRA